MWASSKLVNPHLVIALPQCRHRVRWKLPGCRCSTHYYVQWSMKVEHRCVPQGCHAFAECRLYLGSGRFSRHSCPFHHSIHTAARVWYGPRCLSCRGQCVFLENNYCLIRRNWCQNCRHRPRGSFSCVCLYPAQAAHGQQYQHQKRPYQRGDHKCG